MTKTFRTGVKAPVYLLLFFAAACWATSTARAQCVDSSQVNNFKVRSVKLKTLFGLVPKSLAQTLNSHRGDSYSANKASEYINEIRNFYATDPNQEKYETLIANKLKVSVKAGRTWLECVEKIEVNECQQAFPGTTECVDVTIKRYFIDIDALDSSPYLLLFPRSGLAALYGAMPKALLALNPDFDFGHDKQFGPGPSVNSATDLLDLPKVLEREPSVTPTPAPTPVSVPTASPSDEATFEFGGGTAGSQNEEPSVELNSSDTKLLLRLRGQKSLTKRFYDTGASLSFERTAPLKFFQNINMDFAFGASRLPQGNGDFFRNAGALNFSTDLRFKESPIKLVSVGGGYRWSRNQLFSGDGTVPPEINSESAIKIRGLADGAIKRGMVRASLWFDGNSFNHTSGSYHRLAFLAGYGKDFVIPRKKDFHQISPPELNKPCWTSYPDLKPGQSRKNESTVGVEVLAGAGRIWGDVPEYSRFFAGAPAGQFLYDELSATTITRFPYGPLIRSLGESQGGTVNNLGNVTLGGTSYWHANVNVSIPIPAWSRPLIPHEWVVVSTKREGDEEFNGHAPEGANICRDLKSMIKTLVSESGKNLMASQQAREKLTDQQKNDLRLGSRPNRTPEEEQRLAAATAAFASAKVIAQREVDEIFKTEILPITNFIADHANIIAVKPLFLFDVASLGPRGTDTPTRVGLGGGLQLDIVMARFEFGYVGAIKRAPGDPSGNFFGRMVLRRLF